MKEEESEEESEGIFMYHISTYSMYCCMGSFFQFFFFLFIPDGCVLWALVLFDSTWCYDTNRTDR